jgi:hypothetical protein
MRVDVTAALSEARHFVAIVIFTTLLLTGGVSAFSQEPKLFSSGKGAPQFDQYKVNKIYKGKPAVPVLRTPEDREYRTRIREGAKAGPNFAGHYTVVDIGCGTECASFIIVDAASGRVFSGAQKEYTCAPTFKVDSRLLTTDVCTGAIQKGCNRAFWEWTGTELKFLTRIPTDCW